MTTKFAVDKKEAARTWYMAWFSGGGSGAELAGSVRLYGPMSRSSADQLGDAVYNILAARSNMHAQESLAISVQITGASPLPDAVCDQAGVDHGTLGFDAEGIANEIDR